MEREDPLKVGVHGRAASRKFAAGEVRAAEVGDAHEAIARAEGDDDLGEIRRKGKHPSGRA